MYSKKEKQPNALTSKESLPPPRLVKKGEGKKIVSELDFDDKELNKFFGAMEAKIKPEQELKKAKFILDLLLKEGHVSLNNTVQEATNFIQERINDLKRTVSAASETLKENERLMYETGKVGGEENAEFNRIAEEELEKAERETMLLFALGKFLNDLLAVNRITLNTNLKRVSQLLGQKLQKTEEGI